MAAAEKEALEEVVSAAADNPFVFESGSHVQLSNERSRKKSAWKKNTINEEKLESELEQAQDMNEVLSILKNAGIEATEEELLKLIDSQEEQLSEESLETVSGGGTIWEVFPAIVSVLRKLPFKPIIPRTPFLPRMPVVKPKGISGGR